MTNPLASIKQCRMGTEHSDNYEAQQCDFGSLILGCILRLEKIVSDHSGRRTRELAKEEILRRAKQMRVASMADPKLIEVDHLTDEEVAKVDEILGKL